MRGDRGEVLLIGFGYVKNSEGVGEVRPRPHSRVVDGKVLIGGSVICSAFIFSTNPPCWNDFTQNRI